MFLILVLYTLLGINQNVFHKTFGGYGSELTTRMTYQSGGNYIVSGITNSFPLGIFQLYLSEINTAGQVLWFKTFGLSSSLWDMDMARTSDGNYMIVSSYSVNNQLILIKTNQLGDTIWTKSYGFPLQIRINSIIQSVSGEFFISANVYNGNFSMVLIKADYEGNILWANHYQYMNYIVANDIIPDDNGGLIVS